MITSSNDFAQSQSRCEFSFYNCSIGSTGNRHHEYEILYVKKGRITVRTNGIKHNLNAQECIIIDPYSIHDCYTSDDASAETEYICLLFGWKFLFPDTSSHIYTEVFKANITEDISLSKVINQENALGHKVVKLVQQIVEYTENVDENLLSIQIALLKIFDIVIKNISYFSHKETKIHMETKIIRAATNIIEEKYIEDIRIEQIAKSLNINVDYFIVIFKKYAGITPKQYLIMTRLERSIAILRDKNRLNIFEVAQKCGFSDVSYYSRLFKKRYGMTPTRFREAYFS